MTQHSADERQMEGSLKQRGPDSIALVKEFVATYWPLLLAAAAFLVVQRHALSDWWPKWFENDSYYSHGVLVPLLAAFMVWTRRKRLANTPVRQCWAGYLVLAASVVLFILGAWTLSATMRAVAFVFMLLGIILSLLGTRMTLLLAIPVLFLFSMTPMTQSKLDEYTASMQWKSAAVASVILSASGFESRLEGSTIYADGLPEPLRVAAECSGLKTLISLITFTVFLAYLANAALWKKLLLLVISFPLSLLVNSLRIAMIGYAGALTDSAEAMHSFHNSSGYLGLVICFALLFGLARLLRVKVGVSDSSPDETQSEADEKPKVVFRRIPLLIVLALLAIGGGVTAGPSPIYPRSKGHIERGNIPMRFGSWVGTDLEIDDLSRQVLKSGDLLSRNYVNLSSFRTVQIFITASRLADGFHDPHICLPGGGNMVVKERTITIPIEEPYRTRLNARLMHTRGDYGDSLVLFWYMAGRESLPLTSDLRDRMNSNTRHDLIRLLLSPRSRAEISREAQSRQYMWYRLSTSIVVDEKSDLKELERFVREFVANHKGFGEA